MEGLDLRPYVLSDGGDGSNSLIYDLYAISNHFGSLNGGHYTAYCKNPLDKRWYEFDDSDVSKMDPSNTCTKAAYVLFYRRRKVSIKK